MWRAWLACLVLSARAAAGGDARAALATGGVFSLQTTLQLNAAEARDRDLGYRIEAELSVAPAVYEGDDVLCFTLQDTRLLVRGSRRPAEWAARGSVWDEQRGAASTWCAGAGRALLAPADPPAVRDYKRAVASLFQFQGAPGDERNETDALGECAVSYEALPDGQLRRVWRRCAADEAGGVQARRAARLRLEAGALHALHAEEVLTLHAALKARSWHALARLRPAPPAAPPPPALRPHALPLEDAARPHAADDHDDDHDLDLPAALDKYGAALGGAEAGGGGSLAAARGLLRLLPLLRRAARPALDAALAASPRAALAGLCRALGLAGSGAAAAAAAEFTRLRAADPLEPLARAFLAGSSLAPAAEPAALAELLRAAAEARRPALAARALLAAAAAARAPADRAAVRELALRGLARCRDAACRADRLLALGNLRAETAELLAAAEGDEARAAAAALWALRAAPALQPATLARLARLAGNDSRPLELRAAALELLLERRAGSAHAGAPLDVARLARALHAERGPAAHELRRVLWQRLHVLRRTPPVRALLALLPRELRTWDARAHAGTSHVLRRDTGWGGARGAAGWAAALDSVQLARAGLLRRGLVALLLAPPGGPPAPALEVEVWTRGLQALAGGEAGDDEPAAGGLALSVGGARLEDVTLFEGQAELLAHVWAGAGSEPTPVLRALRPAPEERAALPLLAGVALRARAGAAAALALDAHAAVSLWHRTARGALALRAALLAEVAAAVRAPWAELRARRELSSEPRLRIALALDFYDGVSLCVRAAVPEHALEDELRLRGELSARRLAVSRAVSARTPAPGRTLALGRANDAACRTLHAADDDEL